MKIYGIKKKKTRSAIYVFEPTTYGLTPQRYRISELVSDERNCIRAIFASMNASNKPVNKNNTNIIQKGKCSERSVQ